jgi:transglutaminase-like putative cysteine protease
MTRAAIAYAQSLRHASLPWLMFSALVTIAPHTLYQPLWIGIAAALVLAAVLWQWRRGYRLTPFWLKAALALGGLFGILLHYHTLLDYEAGIALLALTLTLKLLELKSRRDAVIVVTLAYFLLLTHFFYSQSIPAALWLLFGILAVTASLIRLYDAPSRRAPALFILSARLIAQSLPLMALFYLFLPRIEGPLWGMQQVELISRTGLSDTMEPGSLSQLVLSDEIAFRVLFHGPIPRPSQLYWRGPVMNFYDGRTWRAGYSSNLPPTLETSGTPVRYALTLEAHNQHWALAMEMTPRPPEGEAMRLNSIGTLTTRQPMLNRKRFEFTSWPNYRLEPDADRMTRTANLQLPPRINPRARALAAEWQATGEAPRQLANRTVAYFRQGGFSYTLEPPILGEHAIDDFLFSSKRGFCEHYASAFVWMMRAAGVPARVVGGYQGGEFNGEYFVVRQSDAHAWAEIWVEGEGWLRVDPTASVPPEMTDASVRERFISGRAENWLIALRNRWEAIGNVWNQWVLGYNPQQQADLLGALGLTKTNWQSALLILIVSGGTCLAVLALWLLRPRRESDPARRIWLAACRHLEKQGIACPPWESPLTLARRLESEAPGPAPALRHLAQLVTAARYERTAPAHASLRRALKLLVSS